MNDQKNASICMKEESYMTSGKGEILFSIITV